MTGRDKMTQEQKDRLFLVTWGVAMWAAEPPIRTGDTRIPADLANEARALLTELGYDWQAGRRQHLAEAAERSQKAYDRILKDKHSKQRPHRV